MGACYGKGSGSRDPDRAPYAAASGERGRRPAADGARREAEEAEEELPGRTEAERGQARPRNNEKNRKEARKAQRDGAINEKEWAADQLPDKEAIPVYAKEEPPAAGHIKQDTPRMVPFIEETRAAAVHLKEESPVTGRVKEEPPVTKRIKKESPVAGHLKEEPMPDGRRMQGESSLPVNRVNDSFVPVHWKDERAKGSHLKDTSYIPTDQKAQKPRSVHVTKDVWTTERAAVSPIAGETSVSPTTKTNHIKLEQAPPVAIVTNEDVNLEIVEQPKFKAESPWRNVSVSSSRQEGDGFSKALPAKATSSVGQTGAVECQKLWVKEEQNTTKSATGALQQDDSKEDVIKERREDHGNDITQIRQPVVVGADRRDGRAVDSSEKVEIIISKQTARRANDSELWAKKENKPATAVTENGITLRENTEAVDKTTGSSKTEDSSLPPKLNSSDGSPVIRNGKNIKEWQEKSESEEPDKDKGRPTSSVPATKAIVSEVKETTEYEKSISAVITERKISEKKAVVESNGCEDVVGQNKDNDRSSYEGRKTSVSPQNIHSNIPSLTSHGSLRSSMREKTTATTSASSLKSTSTASHLKRTLSGRDGATSVGKPTENIVKKSAKSPSRSESEPAAERYTKEEVLTLLCDLTEETTAVVDKYVLCPNTRSRLIGHIEKWLNGEDKEKGHSKRVWLLTGQAGIGKSTVAAAIYRKFGSDVAAAHFFKRHSPHLDYNDAGPALQSIARQLCSILPNYSGVLPRRERLREVLDDGRLDELFAVLISEPLLAAELKHSAEQAVLIVLDAVDECEPDARQELLRLINDVADKTPDWLHLLITARDENQIIAQLDNVRTVEMKPSADSLVDIKKFLRQPMSRRMDRISLDGGLTQLAKKTEGNFLCARILAGMLDQLAAEKTVALREVDGMFPRGIANCYAAVFGAFRERLGQVTPRRELDDRYQSVVGLLCFALEAMPMEALEQMVKMDKDSLNGLKPVLDTDNGYFALHNRHTIEWLLNEQESGDLHVNAAAGQRRLAGWCLAIINDARRRPEGASYSVALQRYALKHGVRHLLDVPRQQDNVAGLLCELRYIQEKLGVPGVGVRHLLRDYTHRHVAEFGGRRRPVSLSDYMNKHPKLLAQVKTYHQFVRSQRRHLEDGPRFALLVAANYPGCERIRQNALVELEGGRWLEDRTLLPETQHVSVPHPGRVDDADVSSDGKYLAMITSEGESSALVVLNASNGARKFASVDLATVGDRIGLCVRFLADDTALFVGSLTTYVSVRQGVAVPSGVDVGSIPMKERYVVESCAASRGLMVCGLSTLPAGGRSLHLAVIDLRTKRCVRLVDVLAFRFGGSAQLGIKACALADDDALVASLVKESHRCEFVCTVWALPKGSSLHRITLSGATFARCAFVGSGTLLVGSGIRSLGCPDKAGAMEKSKLWNFKAGQAAVDWDEHELYSVFNSSKSGFVKIKWYFQGSRVYVESWRGRGALNEAAETYRIDGLSYVCDVMRAPDHVIVLTEEDVRIYSVGDLARTQLGQGAGVSPLDVQVRSVAFHPRREQLVMAHLTPNERHLGVGTLDLLAEDMTIAVSPLKQLRIDAAERRGTTTLFHGRTTKTDVCQYNSDGGFVIINDGRSVILWNVSADTFDRMDAAGEGQGDGRLLECVASHRDNIMAVVFPDKPDTIDVYDVKSRHLIRSFSLPASGADFQFMPYSGYLMACSGDQLVVWNPRTGDVIGRQEGRAIAYVRLSPASDRLAVSVRHRADAASLTLRNSDRKFCAELETPKPWRPSADANDVEFVADGTVLVGVVGEANACRIWNAGNGEALRDWTIGLAQPAHVIGMVTNWHVLLHDGRLLVVDILTGEVVSSLSTYDGELMTKTGPLGLKISPKGGAVVGATKRGNLKVIQCHNYGSIKRKTTLQIMKSSKK